MAKRGKADGFEKHLEELERIVLDLEAGELSLDDSMKRYQEGVRRLKSCYELLRKAEQQVRVLVRDADGELHEEDLDQEEPGE